MTLEEYLAKGPEDLRERQYRRVVTLTTIMQEAGFTFEKCEYASNEPSAAVIIEMKYDNAALVVY